jgi:hypothetical protein
MNQAKAKVLAKKLVSAANDFLLDVRDDMP